MVGTRALVFVIGIIIIWTCDILKGIRRTDILFTSFYSKITGGSMIYYSDKYSNESGEQLPDNVWGGIVSIVNRSIDNCALRETFPINCPDGNYVTETDVNSLNQTLEAHIPGIEIPLCVDQKPDILVIFDLIEFLHEKISKPRILGRHSYFSHNHYAFDKEEGQQELREEINTILRRNSIRYEIITDGCIKRKIPDEIEILLQMPFSSGDTTLDSLLKEAKEKLHVPSIAERQISIEKIWDAWERVKSIENPNNKSDSTKRILDYAATEPTYRQILEDEARSLTSIGNRFRIRHSEVDKIEIGRESQIDYFFYRMYSLIALLLRERP